MIELENKTSLEVNENLLNNIANLFSEKEIELIITTSEEIQTINQEHRNINNSTDVLIFS